MKTKPVSIEFDRQEYNLEICKMLTEFFLKTENSDIRFFQALAIMNALDYDKTQGSVIDPFNKESKTTNDKIYEFINKQHGI